jgi:hypothetical protein
MPLGPATALLEAVSNLVGRLADGQVFIHVAALPASLLQLYAQGKVLSEGPLWEPASLRLVFLGWVGALGGGGAGHNSMPICSLQTTFQMVCLPGKTMSAPPTPFTTPTPR